MKMVYWRICILALLLLHTTTVVDCDFPDTEVARFNSSEGALYMDFFTPTHETIDNDPGSSRDGAHTCLPVTPKDITAPPKKWIKVNLYSGGSLTPKGATYIRKDSLYTLAFLNVDGTLLHSPAFAHFFKDFRSTMPLPFSESYAGLTGTPEGEAVYPELVKVQIGRAAAELATDTLSIYRGGTANVESVMNAFLTITIMTSEALRIQSIRESCTAAWETTGTITMQGAMEMLAWSGLSLLYRTDDLGQLNKGQLRKVRRTGVTTKEEAGNIIDLVYRPQA
ncbi:hypothetical protein ACQ4PT_052581 [Festuca glaucescens]